ncbi:MAG: signal peptidase I [Longimicrobiales bacterium]|nr:signal peptidase I [Longimicrobiales bacterium]
MSESSRKRSDRKANRDGADGSSGGGTAEHRKSDENQDDEEDRGGWIETLRTLAWSLALFLVLRTFLLQTFFITSGSMKDTMLVGDFLVVNKAATGARIPFTDLRIPGYSERTAGEILVFDPPHSDSLKLVKRLIALPGDTVEMRDRVLYRNGVRVDEPYVRHIDAPDRAAPEMLWQLRYLAPGVDPRSYQPTRDTWGPIVVPDDRYFFLGDNREESFDGRYFGFVRGDQIEGRASFIYFSYDRESYQAFPAITAARWGRIFDRYH